jgi:sigma-B regulation protein RsbU (phosphoserine phosphatase)
MPYLVIQKGPKPGDVLRLERAKNTLGRAWTCTIALDPPVEQPRAISRKHAIILFEEGRCCIADGDEKGLPSRNHTFVNGVQAPTLPARVPLKNEDTIRICNYELVYHDGSVPAEDSPSAIESTVPPDSSSMHTQTAEKLRSLLTISNRLSHSLDLDLLLPQVVENLLDVFKHAERAFLILVDEATGELVLQSHRARDSRRTLPMVYSKSIVQECLAQGQGFLANNMAGGTHKSASIGDLGLQSVMCAPLRSHDGKGFGVLLVDSRESKNKFKQDDLNFLMGVASQASIALANARYHKEALAQERLQRDLALAREVVKSFLPTSVPKMAGYDFFAFNESALAVGGDLHDFIELPGNRLAVLVGDVTGKGVAAALVMARFSAEARACLRTEPDLAAAIRRLNTLIQPLNLTDRFVTLAAVLLDPTAHTLTVVNAGHPPPLLCRQTSGVFEEASPRAASGPPLGVLDAYDFEAHQITLEAGDSVVLFSDGVTDAEDAHGHPLELKGLHAVLQQGNAQPAELGARILHAVQQHAGGRPQYDDITLVCLRRRM